MNKAKTFFSALALLLILSLGWTFSGARANAALATTQRQFLPFIAKARPTITYPTATSLPPTVAATSRPPTATATSRPPTSTATSVPPTSTATSRPPAPTATSPSGSADPYTFISMADTKTGTSTLAALSNQAKKLNPALVIYAGDLVPAGVSTSVLTTWKNAMNGSSSNGMFDMTFPVRGNHDYGSTSIWQGFFDTAGVAARVGATQLSTLTTDQTYSFDYGNARFIGIDVPGDSDLITASEVSYLDSRLTDAESRGLTHAFIFFHGPTYAVSGHTSCTTRTCTTPSSVVSLIKVLNKHAIVSAIFNGHEHVQSYVHMDSSRVPEITHPFEEFITGSAGAELYACNKTFRFDYCGSINGFAAIRVSGKSFTVSIYQMNTASPVKTWTFTKP